MIQPTQARSGAKGVLHESAVMLGVYGRSQGRTARLTPRQQQVYELAVQGVPYQALGVICPMCNMRFENCQCYITEEEDL